MLESLQRVLDPPGNLLGHVGGLVQTDCDTGGVLGLSAADGDNVSFLLHVEPDEELPLGVLDLVHPCGDRLVGVATNGDIVDVLLHVGLDRGLQGGVLVLCPPSGCPCAA